MPEEADQLMEGHGDNASNLPTLLPSASLVLRRTQGALELLRNVVQESSAEYWYERGKAASAAEDWAEAGYSFRQCLLRNSRHWKAALQLAGSLGSCQEGDAAAEALLQAFRLPYTYWGAFVQELPTDVWQVLYGELDKLKTVTQHGSEALLALALVLQVLGKADHARRTLEVIEFMYADVAKSSVTLHCVSGCICNEAEEYKNSIVDCERAIEINPKCVHAYAIRGIAKSELADNSGAIADCDRAIELDPNYAAAYNNRGVVKARLGDNVGAIADHDRAIELDPNYDVAYNNRGVDKFELADYAGAIADYDRAIEIDPNYAAAYINRGVAKHKLSDYNGAIADYDRAIELDPNCAAVYINNGVVKHKLLDYNGAIADYDRAIELDPKNILAYKNRGIAKDNIGDTSGAAADRKKAEELSVK